MRTMTILLITVLISFVVSAQDITGSWNGILKVQGTELRLAFNVSKTDTGYSSTMDSPDQGAKGVPVTNTTFGDSKIKFELKNAGIEYNGDLKGNEFVGKFKQGGQEFPMNLSKKTLEKKISKRPQEPTKPYSYYSEDVIFINEKENFSLSGTLTLPKKDGVFPVVILITGSGPQNRDSQVFGHKPFLVIADYLTKKGIGVLRYDDRGVGQSKGDFKTATSADFATDVESAIAYLKTRKEVNKKKIGLIGHSEGGIIAPIVASRSKDIDFIVLLAGPGLPGYKLMLLQKEKTERTMHINAEEVSKGQEIFKGAYQIILNSKDGDVNLNGEIKTYFRQNLGIGITEEQLDAIIRQIVNPWMISFLKYDPIPTLEKVKCPVLAINGEKDLQVPSKENLTAIKNTLTKGGNNDVTIIEFPNLNHLFQECTTGSPSEYSNIEQTFSPVALDAIGKWIKLQTQ